MRGFALYLLAGTLMVVAMNFIAPPLGLGLPVGVGPTVEQGSSAQSVNRSHKGDRLNLPQPVDKSQSPRNSPTILVGCDPTFSPLSGSGYAQFSGLTVPTHCLT